jgi:hypothetical protein
MHEALSRGAVAIKRRRPLMLPKAARKLPAHHLTKITKAAETNKTSNVCIRHL